MNKTTSLKRPPRQGRGLDAEALRLAQEIATYLAQRDGAADTLEGLVTWWLFRQRLVDTEHRVRLAVEYLCERGVLGKRRLADGSILYVAQTSGAGAASSVEVDRQ